MKRVIALVLFLAMSCLLISNTAVGKAITSNIILEININKLLIDDPLPLDHDDKGKMSGVILSFLLFFFLFGKISIPSLFPKTRLFSFIFPVFYQSNYVI